MLGNPETELIKIIRARQVELQEGVLSATQPDYASYRQMVGENRGLQYALDALSQIMKEDDNG